MIIVTSADAYTVVKGVPADRAAGSIRRVGGGAYVFVAEDGSDKVEVADYDSAVALAEGFIDSLATDPNASLNVELKQAQSTINDLLARIAELERKLSGGAVGVEVAGAVAATLGGV